MGLEQGTASQEGRAGGEHWASAIRGLGNAGSAGLKVGSGIADADKASHEADAAAHKAAADQAQSAAGDMHDAAANANETITAALNFYREYVSTQAQTWNAALHRS